jgi:peptidoglycan/xylan/chitin deacetylase (PgdA/CDA1 family)
LPEIIRLFSTNLISNPSLFRIPYLNSQYRLCGVYVAPMGVDKQTGVNLIRSTCVRVAASAVFYTGVLKLLRPGGYSRVAGDQEGQARCYPFAVLLYHRVNPDNDPFFPAISVKAFDAQMRYLATNYRVLPLAEIIKGVRQGQGIAPNTIALTFDDGYKDNYVYAHPILRKYNLPATLFAATSYIGTEKLMWNDKIAMAVKLTTQQSIMLPGAARSTSLASVPEKLSALEQIIETLKTLREPEKRLLADEIVRHLLQKSSRVEPQMLSWAELRKLAHEGWEVGSHTENHVILTRVPFSEAKKEISLSGSILERELDRRVRLFAYPNGKSGDYDPSIKNFIEDTGYIGAVTTVDRLNGHDVDLFAIGRKSPWEESLAGFALKLQWSFWRQNRSRSQTNYTEPAETGLTEAKPRQ